MSIKPKESDTFFKDSPEAGTPECICSRCKKQIRENEVPVRIYDEENKTEYRYCEICTDELINEIPNKKPEEENIELILKDCFNDNFIRLEKSKEINGIGLECYSVDTKQIDSPKKLEFALIIPEEEFEKIIEKFFKNSLGGGSGYKNLETKIIK